MKDTSFVIPELLQLITTLDELAGLGPLAPKVVFLIRSISGLSVYRQVWKNIRQTYQNLDISIVFALRYNFALDVKPRFPDFELVNPFFRVPQPSGLVQSSPAHMYYTNPLSIDDRTAAERDGATVTPASKVIEQLFTEEWDARAAMMGLGSCYFSCLHTGQRPEQEWIYVEGRDVYVRDTSVARGSILLPTVWWNL